MPPRRRFRRDPAAVGDLLARYRDRRPPGAVPRAAATLDEAWAQACGELAAHTTVLRASRNGVVTIACTDAGVAQELSLRAEELTRALSDAAGRALLGVRAVIADHAVTPRAPAGPPPPPAPPGPEAVAAAEGLAAHVTDPELRAAVQRAAAAALQRRWNR
ncbi:MAG: DciA family protein [Thermoleophilia bacterium]